MVCLLTANIISTAFVAGFVVVCGLWSVVCTVELGKRGQGRKMRAAPHFD